LGDAAAAISSLPKRPRADIKAFGTPEGAYQITDTVSETYDRPTIDSIEVAGTHAAASGRLTSSRGEVTYKLSFEAVSATHQSLPQLLTKTIQERAD
jgi:hypothetical protein